jgi:hypothetical protein
MHGVNASPENASTAAVGWKLCASEDIDASQSQVAVPGNVWTCTEAPALFPRKAKSCAASEGSESP